MMPSWPITHALAKRFYDLGLKGVVIDDCILVAFQQWLADQETRQAERRALQRKRTRLDTVADTLETEPVWS